MLSYVLTVRVVFFLWRERNVSPDTCAAGVATHSADELALVTRFCVQLLLKHEVKPVKR